MQVNSTKIPSSTTQSPKVTVRPELKVHIRNDEQVVLEDPVNGKHYRLGVPEYSFFSELATQGSFQAAHDAANGGCVSWTTETSQNLLNWMNSRQLLRVDGPQPANKTTSQNAVAKRAIPNLLILKKSLGSPERIINQLTSAVRPLLKREVGWLLVATVAYATWLLVSGWEEFCVAYSGLFTPWRTLHIAFVWLLLKIVHEGAHGIACHYWGGRVQKAGIALIFGIPLPYVDLSDSCRFAARSQRVFVALAGAMAECSLAAIAVVAWSLYESPYLHQFAADMALTALVGSLLFNLNPLMKYDGYYVLSELTGIDNLYPRGSHYTAALWQHTLWGKRSSSSLTTPLFIKAYGIASFLWRALAISSIFYLAILMFQGVGIICVVLAILQWWVFPIYDSWNSRRTLPDQTPLSKTTTLRQLLRPMVLFIVVGMSICLLPVPWQEGANAVVEYDPPEIIRSPVNGFVEEIHVTDNQFVQAGELLVTLSNEELHLKQTALDAATSYTDQQLRAALYRQDTTQIQAMKSQLKGLHKQLAENESHLVSLEVRSPITGMVSSRMLKSLTGTYLEAGTEIAAVGSEESKRLRLLIPQKTASQLCRGAELRYLAPGGESKQASLTKILPRTTQEARESVLGANHGGPIAVILDESNEVQFCTPQTLALASLDAESSQQLFVGQRVTAILGTRQRLGEWLWDLVTSSIP